MFSNFFLFKDFSHIFEKKFFMLKTILLVSILIFKSILMLQGQTACDNIDFEIGNFNNWQGLTGFAGGGINSPGIINGRHTVMSTLDFDYYSNGQITRLNPFGGNYSVRLGNDDVNGEAEKLKRTFLVTEETNSIIYFYAVVFEDPDHDVADQPRFKIQVFDQNGNVINDPCFNYSVTASSNIPGFFQSDVDEGVYFKPWTPVALNLSNYINQNVTIEFVTEDCGLGGHFGYAYFDALCSKLEIYRSQCDNDTVTLWLPQGYNSYAWNTGQTTQSIQVANPVIGTQYSVVAITESGCQNTFNYVYDNTLLSPPLGNIQAGYCNNYNSAVITAPFGFENYTWSNGTNGMSTNFSDFNNGDTVYVELSGGVYCDTTLTFILNNTSIVSNDTIFISQTYCPNLSDSVTVKAPTGNFLNYVWADGSTGNQILLQNVVNNQSITVLCFAGVGCPTLYSIQLIAEEINQNINISFDVCDMSLPFNLNANEGFVGYLWDNGSTLFSTNVIPQNSANICVSMTQPNGCNIFKCFNFVNIPPLPNSNDTIQFCAESPNLLLTGITGNYSYLWNSGSTLPNLTIPNPQDNDNFSVKMSYDYNCYFFKYIQLETYKLSDDDIITITPYCETTKIVFLKAPDGFSNYIWNNNETGQYNVSYPATFGATFSVVFTSVNNCEFSQNIVLDYNNLPIEFNKEIVSNALSPNNDGLNDELKILITDYDYFELTVFNRWGDEVFRTLDANVSWNGKSKENKLCTPGTYYYILKLKGCDKPEIVEFTGTINLF